MSKSPSKSRCYTEVVRLFFSFFLLPPILIYFIIVQPHKCNFIPIITIFSENVSDWPSTICFLFSENIIISISKHQTKHFCFMSLLILTNWGFEWGALHWLYCKSEWYRKCCSIIYYSWTIHDKCMKFSRVLLMYKGDFSKRSIVVFLPNYILLKTFTHLKTCWTFYDPLILQ